MRHVAEHGGGHSTCSGCSICSIDLVINKILNSLASYGSFQEHARQTMRVPYVQRPPVPKTMTTQARREFALGLEKFIGSLLMWIKDRFFRIS